MSSRLRLILILVLGTHVALAQVPAIQKVEPLQAHPNDTILITGSGFSATPANLEVWFGQVRGQVIASSDFAIEVVVPAEARLENVEVLNKTSFSSAKSSLKFMPVFQGQQPFDVSKFNTTLVEGQNKFGATEELWDLSASDLNLDGKPDIVATKFQSPAAFFLASSDIMILQNVSTPGNLDFNKFDKTNMPVLNLNFPSDNVVTGDLQGDGKPEIIVSRGGSTRNTIHILRNTSTPGGAINFVLMAPLPLQAGHVATRMRIRDLNRDGKPEIIVSNTFNDVVYIFINQSSGGTLSFNSVPIKLSVRVFASDPSSTNYEVEVQDFNGDDLPDLVVNEFQDDSLHIFTNTSAGSISFAQRVTIPTVEKLNRLTSVDVNADGKLDLLATSTLNDQVLVFTNESNGAAITFAIPPTPLTTGDGVWGFDVSDINGDGFPDLIDVNRDQKQINIFTHNGNNASPGFNQSDIAMPDKGRNVKVADYDGDGKPDIALTAFNNEVTPNTSSIQILRNTNCHQPDITNTEPPEDLLICASQSLVLKTTAAEGVTYSWTRNNAPVGGDEPYLSITAPSADYIVTATAEGGACVVASAEITVTEDTGLAPADPAVNANTPLCTGGSLQLGTDPVPGGVYSWTGPNGFTSNLEDPVINNMTQDQAGFYELQVTVDVCKSHVATIRVDVADLADFSISSNNPTNTVCAGGTVALSVNNLANHTYQWKLNGSNITTNGTNASLTAAAEGNYSVEITNTVLSCATEVGPVAITVLTPPVADYDVAAAACTGEEVAFTNQSTVDSRATTVYTWAFGDGDTEQADDPTHIYNTAQVFNTGLTVSYSGVAGCTDNATSPVTVSAASIPSINSTAATLCPDGVANLSVSQAFASILWSTAETANSITVTGPGTYSVATTDNNGCAGTDEVTIAALPAPEITATADPATVPAYGTTQLNATSTNGEEVVSWSWSYLPVPQPDEVIMPQENKFIANPEATVAENTVFTVTGTNADNCSTQAQVTVTVEGVLGFPVFFSPNSDGKNDEWNIRAQDKPDCTLSIFDGRGRRVYEAQGQNWDGTYEGKAVPTGTYYYVFGCPDEKPATGTVLVVK